MRANAAMAAVASIRVIELSARSGGVKFPLKMLIYKSRFFGEICLLRPSLIAFFNALLVTSITKKYFWSC
jgi:hypothetical protein